jgi:hypothetical protein
LTNIANYLFRGKKNLRYRLRGLVYILTGNLVEPNPVGGAGIVYVGPGKRIGTDGYAQRFVAGGPAKSGT